MGEKPAIQAAHLIGADDLMLSVDADLTRENRLDLGLPLPHCLMAKAMRRMRNISARSRRVRR